MSTVYVGVGSNVGDRVAFCRKAVESLRTRDGFLVGPVSSLYETSPIGGPPQRSFINLVAQLEATLEPRAVLEAFKEVEATMGREPSEIRWGPRVVDLDLLLYDDLKVNEPDLEIPHPRLTQRRFALVPLLEIAPDITDPWGKRYADWLEEAEGDVEQVEPF